MQLGRSACCDLLPEYSGYAYSSRSRRAHLAAYGETLMLDSVRLTGCTYGTIADIYLGCRDVSAVVHGNVEEA